MLAADRGVGRAPEKRKKQRAAGADGGGLPGQPVLSGYREGEAWGWASLACLSEAHAIKVLIKSIHSYKHPDWSAKSSNPA